MFDAVRAVMIFCPSPERAARWWGDLLGLDVHLDVDGESVFAWLNVGAVEFGFHQADESRNPHGASTVPYWSVEDLDRVRERLLAAGCTHHRGPLQVSRGRRICQVIDPFGCVIGLDGP
ncbi:VOC family protein [Kitasatospora sp. NPDC004669]|uniref:VOC family protein n=1 Tax=Kitasatospora sp. NPDC004669 TaxID=3154555 RepID=UPI00339FE87F